MPAPTFYIVSLATIISILYYKKFKSTIYKYFIIYLYFTFIIEFLGTISAILYRKESLFVLNTNPVYNIYIVVTFLFYLTFYKSLFRNNNNKKTINIFLLLYLLFIPFDLFILKTHFLNDFFANNLVFGSTLLVITLILFLIEIINNEKIVFNIKKSFIFWISVGALLFYIGVIPIIISSEYLNFKGLYHTILTPLNIIMYGCFVVGFITSNPKYNY